jgi:hypothetical protein
MNYYILENGKVIESRWEKEPGDRHLESKIKSVTTKGEYDWFVSEQTLKTNLEIKQHNKKVREINKIANLRLAGVILGAGNRLNIDVKDTLTAMKDLAPGSFNELKKHIK